MPGAPAFEMNPKHDHLSVNWLEIFESSDKVACIAEIRQALLAKQYKLRRNGRFAVLNVGQAKQKVRTGAGKEVRILHWPKDNDTSHSGLFDYTSEDFQVALDLKSLVTARDVYPAFV